MLIGSHTPHPPPGINRGKVPIPGCCCRRRFWAEATVMPLTGSPARIACGWCWPRKARAAATTTTTTATHAGCRLGPLRIAIAPHASATARRSWVPIAPTLGLKRARYLERTPRHRLGADPALTQNPATSKEWQISEENTASVVMKLLTMQTLRFRTMRRAIDPVLLGLGSAQAIFFGDHALRCIRRLRCRLGQHHPRQRRKPGGAGLMAGGVFAEGPQAVSAV